jgi:hypothetical protein
VSNITFAESVDLACGVRFHRGGEVVWHFFRGTDDGFVELVRETDGVTTIYARESRPYWAMEKDGDDHILTNAPEGCALVLSGEWRLSSVGWMVRDALLVRQGAVVASGVIGFPGFGASTNAVTIREGPVANSGVGRTMDCAGPRFTLY